MLIRFIIGFVIAFGGGSVALAQGDPVPATEVPAPVVEGPGQGAYEVALSGEFGRFFQAEFTGFDLGVGLGYFLSDTVELTLNVGIGNGSDDGGGSSEAPGGGGARVTIGAAARTGGTGAGDPVVAAIPSAGLAGGGWTTSLTVGARFFLPGRRPLAGGLAPFVGLEAGGLLVEEVDPFVIGAGVLGARIPLGARAAFTPQAGYLFIHATDDGVRFGDSKTEHGLAASWSLSVFF